MSEEEGSERTVLPSAVLKVSRRVDTCVVEDLELQASGHTLAEALEGVKALKEMSKP